ncbi:MAG: DUF2807 domain-containing protein [Balneolales bacterium]|nr:DUF2807 domain-containing protein [Balneolales bacterium]
MKTSMQKMALAIAMALVLTTTSFAQTTHLRDVELASFKQIEVSLDTEVILLKSTRNHLTLVGDSSFISAIPIIAEDETLSFHYQAEPENKLKRVVIEYKEIDRITTGGVGTYYFHKMNQDDLFVLNPYANVVLNGNAEKIRVISQEGSTDVTSLTSGEKIMRIGESAQLIAKQR